MKIVHDIVRKRLLTVLCFLLPYTLEMLGCASRAKSIRQRSTQLSIILTSPLIHSAKETSLPEEIVKLCLPVQDTLCSDMAFIPDVWLVRLDLSEPKKVRLDTKPITTWKEKLRNFWGQPLSIAHLTEEIKASVTNWQLPHEFSSPNSRTISADEKTINGYISSVGANHVFVLAEDKGKSWGTLGGTEVVTASDANVLSQHIASHLCQAIANDTTGVPNCIVLYKPSLKGAGPGPKPPDPRCNALFERLAHKLEHASPQELQQLDDSLVKAQTECLTDYRFTYERAKLAVYGAELSDEGHHEAFELLNKAAQIAIKFKAAELMLKQLNNDAMEGRPLHNLTRGHSEWHRLLESLETKYPPVLK